MVNSTPNKAAELPLNGEYNDQWEDPVNGDFTFLDAALGSTIVFNATAGSQTLSQSATSRTLGTYSYVPMFITVTGAISADVTYTIPTGVGGTWIVRNVTTDGTGGPWSVFFTYAGGGDIIEVVRGRAETICCDTTASSPIIGLYKPDSTPADDSITTAMLQDGAVTYDKINDAALATVAEYRAGSIGDVSFIGVVAGNTSMTVTSVSGTIIAGMELSSGTISIQNGTTIVNQTSGTTGGAGTYAISIAQTFGGSVTGSLPDTIIRTSTAWNSAGFVTLTDGATITPDFALGYNFSVNLNGSRVLANPNNMKVGQSGLIVVTIGTAGASFSSYGTYWKFPNGAKPSFTTTVGAVNILSYCVYNSTDILVSGFTGVTS